MAFLPALSEAFLHVLSSPFKDLSALWQLIPLFLMWLMLEVYFVHWHEELGWNSAMSNATTLFWVCASMLQVLFGTEGSFGWMKLIILLSGMLYAVFLGYVVFKHAIDEKIAFAIADPELVHFMGMVFVLWGHGSLEISWMVVLVLVILYGVFFGISTLLKHFLQKDSDDASKSENPFGDTSSNPPGGNGSDPFGGSSSGADTGLDGGMGSDMGGDLGGSGGSSDPLGGDPMGGMDAGLSTPSSSTPPTSNAPPQSSRRRRKSPF